MLSRPNGFCCKKHINWFLYNVFISLEGVKKQRVKEIIIHFNDNDIRAFLRSSCGPSSWETSQTYDGSLLKNRLCIYIRGQWNMAVMVSKCSQCLSILFSSIIYHYFVRGFVGKKWYKSVKTVCVCLMHYYNDYIKVICHLKL